MHHVALVGAGYIADVHAEALKALPSVRLAAVVDPARGRAEALARRWGIPAVYGSIEELIAAGTCTVAHVLTPPPHHRAPAEALLRAGLDVLVEKPMAETGADCAALQEAARSAGRAVSVNQNFVHHPAHRALKEAVDRGELGPLRHVCVLYNMPLAQLSARQFGHWMFDRPRNLLLEQAVHPMSQIEDLLGPIGEISVTPAPARRFGDIELNTTWLVSMTCARGTAQLQFSLGQTYPVWQVQALCDDGMMTADCINDRAVRQEPGKGMDCFDSFQSGLAAARQLAAQSRRNLASYALSVLKLKPRSDAFFRSMSGSIRAFYQALETDRASLDGALGRRLVEACERIAAAVPERARRRPAPVPQNAACDVLVIGGTGFIGQHLVGKLTARGSKVAVMARNLNNLPDRFHGPGVVLVRGDASRAEDVRRAVEGVPVVINLAHGGGATTWEGMERAIVGGARGVAEACLDAGVRRLVHVGTIAALDLGDPQAVITGETPPDPRAETRDFYTRAKAAADTLLMRMHRERGLPVTILRPGVVVGEGGIAFHSGIGFYNRERHCLGWNAGTNPLPLVLAEDVADAILRAIEAPAAVGRSYNVVGDVRLTAREYTEQLARALGRPLVFHPQSLGFQFAVELLKWAVKKAAGRKDAAFPNRADLASRGAPARFDTEDIKRDLGWQPVADRARFIERAFAVHAG
ncbi:NAD-dependent epimerase/dehydratase family protein [Arenibaculum pallidiluteum]|uniref:NAD-dependent epimerase/dehydratase family protein n=1 Tax=Arenibaculum pallidiluteum TaxID=2812559 RepID=UPI001A962FD3|nr:NAD-dependent epimerase/dehydratase family protein [Arenibaculum pallidiluteum]